MVGPNASHAECMAQVRRAGVKGVMSFVGHVGTCGGGAIAASRRTRDRAGSCSIVCDGVCDRVRSCAVVCGRVWHRLRTGNVCVGDYDQVCRPKGELRAM